MYVSYEEHMSFLDSARYIKAFQKQKRHSQLIMTGVQNIRDVVAKQGEIEEIGRRQNMPRVSCQDKHLILDSEGSTWKILSKE